MLAFDEIRALHQAIGLVIIVPLADGSLSVEGPTPDWLRKLGGGELQDPDHTIQPLVDSFLPEAEAFWTERRPGRLRSGIFTVMDSEDKECHFEISALTIGMRKMLILELLNHEYVETQAVYQKARESFLLFKKALQTETTLRAGISAAEATSVNVAHTLGNWCDEMRRPVDAVMGSSSVLMEQDLTVAQRDMVGVIRRNAQALLDLINNVLDFSTRDRQDS